MKLIVGLGNPGNEYEQTRHNLGFLCVEQFLKDFSPVEKTIWSKEKKFKSEIAAIEYQPQVGKLEKVVLVKPQTFMNNSGEAVSLLKSFYKVKDEDVWVINDDLDLPLGALKIRFGGAAGGHHGVESIIEKLATDKFWRFKIGIGSPVALHRVDSDGEVHGKRVLARGKVDGYVLGKITKSEENKIHDGVRHAVKAIEMALEKDIKASQNKYNTT